jgi:hypothetical protein
MAKEAKFHFRLFCLHWLYCLYWLFCFSLLQFGWAGSSTARRAGLNARLLPTIRG